MSIPALWHSQFYVDYAAMELSTTDKMVFQQLAWYHDPRTGFAWPKQSTLAKRCLLTRRSVNASLQRLEAAGLITIEDQFGDGGRQISSRYKFHNIQIRDMHADEFVDPADGGEDSIRCETGSYPLGTSFLPPVNDVHTMKEHPIEKKKERRMKKPPDPRSGHPAILAFKKFAGQPPNVRQYDKVIASLGESPDLDRLAKCYEVWCVDKGISPFNLVWCTEWYADPSQIPGKKKSAYQPDWNAGGTGKLVL